MAMSQTTFLLFEQLTLNSFVWALQYVNVDLQKNWTWLSELLISPGIWELAVYTHFCVVFMAVDVLNSTLLW